MQVTIGCAIKADQSLSWIDWRQSQATAATLFHSLYDSRYALSLTPAKREAIALQADDEHLAQALLMPNPRSEAR
jgi:hypothetical protein